MKSIKITLLTTLTAVILVTPALAEKPENPVCNKRNCDYPAMISEMPDPECTGDACDPKLEVDATKRLRG